MNDILHDMDPLSIYLHIPFCERRCAYCDFNTYAGLENLIPDYVLALCKEMEYIAGSAMARLPVHTIYFGGGTPSLVQVNDIEKIIFRLSDSFAVKPEAEITIEANPGTVSRENLRELKELGINRLSIGMQSALEPELRLLGRRHTFGDVTQAVGRARQVGFDNINLDLIYGLPGQVVADWSQTLDSALSLKPEHLSLYALTLEEDTPMAGWIKQGQLSEPDSDMAADMYETGGAVLEKAGYESYEISNWASCDPDGNCHACRHNLQYWQGKPYLGFGAGAHGYVNHIRTANVRTPMAYIARMQGNPGSGTTKFPVSPAVDEYTILSREDEMGEVMMMGLRLTKDGVAAQNFKDRFGQTLEQCYGSQIQRLIGLGLLEWVEADDRRLRLTVRGRLLGNQVFSEFI